MISLKKYIRRGAAVAMVLGWSGSLLTLTGIFVIKNPASIAIGGLLSNAGIVLLGVSALAALAIVVSEARP